MVLHKWLLKPAVPVLPDISSGMYSRPILPESSSVNRMLGLTTVVELLEMDRATLDRITETHPRVRQVLEEFYVSRASTQEERDYLAGGGFKG